MYHRVTTLPQLGNRWKLSLAKGLRWSSQAQAQVSQKDMLALIKELRQMSGSPIKDCKKALETSEGNMEAAWDFLRAQGVATARKKAGNAAEKGLVACSESECGTSAVLVEVSTETEFCEDNPKFQALVREISDAALAAPGLAFPCDDAALSAMTLTNRAEPTDVSTAVTDLVASVRENIRPRRAVRVDAGVVGSYVHSRKAPGLGLKAGLVGLRADSPLGPEAREALLKLGKNLAMHVVAASPAPRYVTREEVTKEDLERERAVLMSQLETEGKVPETKREAVAESKLKQFYADHVLLDSPYCLADDSKTTVKMVLEEASKELGLQVEVVGFERASGASS